ARIVAKRFGTDHHEFRVEPEEAVDVLEKLVWHYNEPYADSSAVPTYYLSKMTRAYVTVALNGDAGDENFAGYERYATNLRLSRMRHAPALVSTTMGNLMALGSRIFSHNPRLEERMRMLSEVMRHDWRLGYAYMLAQFREDRKLKLYTPEFASRVREFRSEDRILELFDESDTTDPIDSTLYVDVNSYLPDDLLVKVDIASMAVALEARSPM